MAFGADFDSSYSFYYDETNNIRKFYVRENEFNSPSLENFVLGGLVHEGEAPDVTELVESFKLQKTVKEVKFKHIARGEFVDCLKSEKLKLFLQFLKDSSLFVHYSSFNILYWSIVDIVDSAISNSGRAKESGLPFAKMLKNDLYKLARLEIDSVAKLFYKFEYPNVKKDSIIPFIQELSSLFDGYIDQEEFHFGLKSLRQILEEAQKNESLPFITNEEDYILLKDFSLNYLRPIYLFKNSTHVFDNEDSVSEVLEEYKILVGTEELSNYSFTDSQSSRLIQLSDVFVGLLGKLFYYFNTSSREKIEADVNGLTDIQTANLGLLLDVIGKSHSKNIGFIHYTDSHEEHSKMDSISEFYMQLQP